jgi:class 3 adenylate cyclase
MVEQNKQKRKDSVTSVGSSSGTPVDYSEMQSGNVSTKTNVDVEGQFVAVLPDSSPFSIKRMQEATDKIMSSQIVIVTLIIFTVWTLFADDIRVLATDRVADTSFIALLIVALVLFTMEIFATLFFSKEYLGAPYGSFYLWCDILASLSLLVEVVSYYTFSPIAPAVDFIDKPTTSRTYDVWLDRILSIIRMLRMVRLVKLYKYLVQEQREHGEDRGREKLGTAMTDLTLRRVITLVLMMLVIIPLLTRQAPAVYGDFETEILSAMGGLWISGDKTGLDIAMSFLQDNNAIYLCADTALCAENNATFLFQDSALLESLRVQEVQHVTEGTANVMFNRSDYLELDAWATLTLTLFVIILLAIGSYFLTEDVNRLAIVPIEKMVALVKRIEANPLGSDIYRMMGEDEGFKEGMETTLLLQTITKIGSLMRVGFGEAGATVIAKNVATGKGGRLNMMAGGEMIHSIFGFCDVRNFTDTTECLQEEVMLFVNRIAHILHSIVAQCSGSANKNIGDAFLLTWKIPKDSLPEQMELLADQALVAFLKALAELNRNQDFICNFTAAATARLYKRFPGYNVRIGSGLHVGWAIEGAIGTHRKIDASYLSPHVNMSEFLESSTKSYGVALLMSEQFWKMLGTQAKRYTRQVDFIRNSDKDEPFGLYTYDCDLDHDFNQVIATKSAIKAANVFKLKLALRRAKYAAAKQEENMTPFERFCKDYLGIAPKSALDAAAQTALLQQQAAQAESGLAAGDDEEGDALAPLKESMNMRNTARVRRESVHTRKSLLVRGADKKTVVQPANNMFHGMEMKSIAARQEALKEERRNRAPTIKVGMYSPNVWERDQDIITLRHLVNDSFRATWRTGMQAYIAGDWAKARGIFEKAVVMNAGGPNGQDGPAQFLLKRMEDLGNSPPADWEGYTWVV